MLAAGSTNTGSAPVSKSAQPFSPRVTSTFLAPCLSRASTAAFTSDPVLVGSPVSACNSGSFGQTRSQSGQMSAGSCFAGAVFKSVMTPQSLAMRRAAIVASMGASNCTIRSLQALILDRAASMSATESWSTAPGTMIIEFCAVFSFTITDATPEEMPATWDTCAMSTPCVVRFLSISVPKMSSPTFEIIMTSAPNLAACTAWLAPLPPKPVANLLPTSVSPGFGSRGA
mmetsp:Transcript_65677/g.129416  ORF Transcript_65677/g.129416 Transcript_65677/m.129416 type:complete len:229 (+) Transcript_65677:1376-2062(+)